jgi:hypothetical protein
VHTRHLIAAITLAVLAIPLHAAAQQGSPAPSSAAVQQSNVPQPVQQATEDIEDTVRRFRVGVRGGVGLDPELIDFGAHATFGPIFTPNLSFRPGIEFGVGEVTTMFGINLDVLYSFPGATRSTRWAPYVGAGPNFALSHQSFDTTDEDPDAPNRFDFSDTDFESGFNFIAGARSRSGMFFELNATAYGVSNVRLLVGYNF